MCIRDSFTYSDAVDFGPERVTRSQACRVPSIQGMVLLDEDKLRPVSEPEPKIDVLEAGYRLIEPEIHLIKQFTLEDDGRSVDGDVSQQKSGEVSRAQIHVVIRTRQVWCSSLQKMRRLEHAKLLRQACILIQFAVIGKGKPSATLSQRFNR